MVLEFKGTQGDWVAVKHEGYDYDVLCEGDEVCWLGLGVEDLEEQKANAKLIAAAPDLLKATQYALKILEDVNHHKIDWVRGTVRNAIEKALK